MSRIEIDGSEECYTELIPFLNSIKDVNGITCEVGLRRGGGSHFIMDTLLKNNDKRTHIAIDPYGSILYTDIKGTHRTDYTNKMKNETLSALFLYAYENDIDFIFFNMEDSEFYQRFSDGVPVYDLEKKVENMFAFVHIDGQHDKKSVLDAATYFIDKISKNGFIAFDNTDHYDHTAVDLLMKSNGYEMKLNINSCNRIVYKKI